MTFTPQSTAIASISHNRKHRIGTVYFTNNPAKGYDMWMSRRTRDRIVRDDNPGKVYHAMRKAGRVTTI